MIPELISSFIWTIIIALPFSRNLLLTFAKFLLNAFEPIENSNYFLEIAVSVLIAGLGWFMLVKVIKLYNEFIQEKICLKELEFSSIFSKLKILILLTVVVTFLFKLSPLYIFIVLINYFSLMQTRKKYVGLSDTTDSDILSGLFLPKLVLERISKTEEIVEELKILSMNFKCIYDELEVHLEIPLSESKYLELGRIHSSKPSLDHVSILIELVPDSSVKYIAQHIRQKVTDYKMDSIAEIQLVFAFVASLPIVTEAEHDYLNRNYQYPLELLWNETGKYWDHGILASVILYDLGYSTFYAISSTQVFIGVDIPDKIERYAIYLPRHKKSIVTCEITPLFEEASSSRSSSVQFWFGKKPYGSISGSDFIRVGGAG